jgi:hypothetical protein
VEKVGNVIYNMINRVDRNSEDQKLSSEEKQTHYEQARNSFQTQATNSFQIINKLFLIMQSK